MIQTVGFFCHKEADKKKTPGRDFFKMTTHKLRNIKSEKVKEINFKDETPSITGGFKNEFDWLVTGMVALMDLRNGQPNGQFIEYKATFKIDENEIYGARHMKVFNLANTGADPSDELTDGIRHKGVVTGEIYQLILKLV